MILVAIVAVQYTVSTFGSVTMHTAQLFTNGLAARRMLTMTGKYAKNRKRALAECVLTDLRVLPPTASQILLGHALGAAQSQQWPVLQSTTNKFPHIELFSGPQGNEQHYKIVWTRKWKKREDCNIHQLIAFRRVMSKSFYLAVSSPNAETSLGAELFVRSGTEVSACIVNCTDWQMIIVGSKLRLQYIWGKNNITFWRNLICLSLIEIKSSCRYAQEK